MIRHQRSYDFKPVGGRWTSSRRRRGNRSCCGTRPRPQGREQQRQRFANVKRWAGNSVGFFLITGMLTLASGCGKKAAPMVATPPPEAPAQAAALPGPATPPPPQPYSPVTLTPPASTAPDLSQINHAYIGWIMQTHRHAHTVEEFVAASGVQLPPAPTGKKYVIDRHGYIALANQ